MALKIPVDMRIWAEGVFNAWGDNHPVALQAQKLIQDPTLDTEGLVSLSKLNPNAAAAVLALRKGDPEEVLRFEEAAHKMDPSDWQGMGGGKKALRVFLSGLANGATPLHIQKLREATGGAPAQTMDPEFAKMYKQMWSNARKRRRPQSDTDDLIHLSRSFGDFSESEHSPADHKEAARFWHGFEEKLHPRQFAMAGAMSTGRPYTHTDWKGQSETVQPDDPTIHHLRHYAYLSQERLLSMADSTTLAKPSRENTRVQIKMIGGKPHVWAYRGVTGNYASKILQAMGHEVVDKDDIYGDGRGHTPSVSSGNLSHTLKSHKVAVPVSPITSWSTHKRVADGFAEKRFPGHAPVGFVVQKWVPVDQVVHLGWGSTIPQQGHAYPGEREIVTLHKPVSKQPDLFNTTPADDAIHKVTISSYDIASIHLGTARGVKPKIQKKLKPKVALVMDTKPEAEPEPEWKPQAVQKSEPRFGEKIERAFRAACLLAHGREPEQDDELREDLARAVYYGGDDIEAMALRAVGLEPTPANIAGLRAAVGFRLIKNVKELPEVKPMGPSSEGAAADITEHAYQAKQTHLEGRHIAGSWFVPGSVHDWIIKTSEAPGPISGTHDESAPAGVREAAFYAVAKTWGLADSVPETHLVALAGLPAAAIEWLPERKWQNAQDAEKENAAGLGALMEAERQRGAIFKWAVLDWVLGNGDRHGHNVLVDLKDQKIRLIDHGSAFAGRHFMPAVDATVFTPWYLRSTVESNGDFNRKPPSEKLANMPEVPKHQRPALTQWLHSLDATELARTLESFKIPPQDFVQRLEKLKREISLSDWSYINRVWVSP